MPTQTLVLDTNTVMALWVFEDPTLLSLRTAIEDGAHTLVTRADALEELRRVLAYRQFGLDPARQTALHAAYTGRCAIIGADDATDPAPLPICRDRDDQKFLEIARDAGASLLVSRDKALLRLNRHRLIRGLFQIVKPDQLIATDVGGGTRAIASP